MVSSSSGSSLSVISGTVGRERPWAMGACVRGVFWGVGAVGSRWLIGIEVDMVVERKIGREAEKVLSQSFVHNFRKSQLRYNLILRVSSGVRMYSMSYRHRSSEFMIITPHHTLSKTYKYASFFSCSTLSASAFTTFSSLNNTQSPPTLI